MWKETAIRQMMDHNIPASITLAQGILESGSGNSALATKGNNHFGIKCHGWTGKKMYVDDDAKGECFRVYKDASDSYEDHSTFLKTYSRYAFLFEYDVTDYKSWAKGLKKAGYATSPTYPEKLIKIIEELDLDQYDSGMQLEAPQLI
ncbi:MAG: glucosaminidase domain-containing protein, partial [bacterium]|nr:glucosaminidase domain-containing protein [bacterium]